MIITEKIIENMKTEKGGWTKMSEDFEPKAPDYAGDGISIWKAVDKNGKTYLRIKKPEWKQSIACFKVEIKEKSDI